MPSRRDSGPRPGARPHRTRPSAGRSRDGLRDGASLRRTAVAREATPEARPSRNLTGRAAVVLLVIGALVVSYAQSLRVWFDQHQQISSLQKEIQDRQNRVGQLQDEIARWDDPAYVRAQARQRLGWVMPGEIGYRVIGADGKPVGAPATPSGTTTGTPGATWYTKLWGSVEVAGRPAATPTTPTTKPTPKPVLGPTPTPSGR